MDWIDVAQGRVRWRALINVVMNLQAPQNTADFLTRTGSFSRRTLLRGVNNYPTSLPLLQPAQCPLEMWEIFMPHPVFAAQCFNIESTQKVFLCHSCV
jgi:hypothetical protein